MGGVAFSNNPSSKVYLCNSFRKLSGSDCIKHSSFLLAQDDVMAEFFGTICKDTRRRSKDERFVTQGHSSAE